MNISNLKKNKYLVLLFGLILISAIITILIPQKRVSPVSTGNPGIGIKSTNGVNSDTQSDSSSKKPFDLFGLFKKSTTTSSGENNSAGQNPQNASSQAGSSSLSKIGASTGISKLASNQTSTGQGTITYNSDVKADTNTNTKKDDIKIIFENPDGSIFTYVPPGTPPDEVRWARYVNHNDKYSLNFPSNWQFFYSVDNGHEGVALYPPGTNPNDPATPYMGFGVTDSFLLPGANGANGSHVTPIIVDGVSGNLYTNGSLGNSFIASALSYSGRYFGLGSSKSTTTFAYIYYYMINTLNFNVE